MAVDLQRDPAEASKLAFNGHRQSQRDIYLTAAVERARHHPGATDAVLQLALDRKGLLLEAALPIARSGEPTAIAALRQRLRDAASRLTRAWLAAPDSPEASAAVLADLERDKEALQQELARKSATFGAAQAAQHLDRRSLCTALGPERLSVEFVRYDHAHFGHTLRWEPRLLALVLEPVTCQLTMLELGDWPTIADLLADLRIHARGGLSRGAQALGEPEPAARTPADAAKALYTRLIAPWLPKLGANSKAVLIPDDALAFAPFAALVAPDGKYLIEKFAFSLLDSVRQLPRLQLSASVGRGTLIVGGPDFDADMALRSGPGHPASAGHTRRLAPLRTAAAASPWQALPGAATEAHQLAALLGGAPASSGVLPKLLVGVGASEASWKALARGQRYLHLATHGYFARTTTAAQRAAANRNPLLLSGLVFAGANRSTAASQGGSDSAESGEDGWLSAEEVAELDLQGTELVVLSACETGLGQAGTGEGVFGLRRAFVQAGARGLLMSLWNVDDAATASFMVKFWTRMVACAKTGCDKATVVAETQRDMLADPALAAPKLWAAFVFAGL